ncbi:PepSY domain-containing protein [Acidovorax sp. SRB_24]|uniref:PepSY domain-containing protein n=1 Tax=Acidovorax sp. SRB_24 TaxID=1962700 RepID=UPI00145C4248|nr:PepSY domain-containing protein [Acidovorax sp. SRB_24]NMM76511.1 hypothetical protein [Acidovorax sp. SRB_24]
MNTRTLCTAAAALLLGTSAFAATPCTVTPKDTPLTQDQMLGKLVAAGYTIESFGITQGSCYQMRGWDKDGNRVKIVHHPVDGRVMKMKMASRSS